MLKCIKIKVLIPFSIFLAITSCSLTKSNLRVSQLSYCAPTSNYIYDSAYIPLIDINPYLAKNKSLLKKYSYQDLLLANASGSFFLLLELNHLQQSKTDDEDSIIYSMVKKQQIFNRLLLASTELASIAAELDCESERSKQLANYLDQINDTRVQRLTILSVITGAATAIITSVSSKQSTQISVGVNGSIISAIFGGLAVFSSHKSITLTHNRNLLADIWQNPKTSTVYPPFIWFVLTAKEFNDDKSSTTIQSLKSRWIEEELVDTTKKAKKQDLFFGSGGKYLANDLHTRTSMLNQLKAEIRSINQNLQSFMLKLSV
jgi:hypothetical protein